MKEKPLLTFALLAYNQKQFVREAVASALAQDYENLEIILSDDCSEDSTYLIIKNMVDSYSGPHRVIVNRNATNLGICGHVNKLIKLMQGELIIMAAGDDVSCPTRSRLIFSAWEQNGREADLIHSSVTKVELDGSVLGKWSTPLCMSGNPLHLVEFPVVVGATAAYTYRLFRQFGELSFSGVREDRALSFRAAIAGGLLYIKEPLVKYRVGGISSSEYNSVGGDKNVRLGAIEISEIAQMFMDGGKAIKFDRILYQRMSRVVSNIFMKRRYEMLHDPKGIFIFLTLESLRGNEFCQKEFMRRFLPRIHRFLSRLNLQRKKYISGDFSE